MNSKKYIKISKKIKEKLNIISIKNKSNCICICNCNCICLKS